MPITEARPAGIRRLPLDCKKSANLATVSGQNVVVVEELAQTEPKLLDLVGRRQALDLSDKQDAALLPGQVELGFAARGRPRRQPAGFDRGGKRVLGVDVSSSTSVNDVRVDLERDWPVRNRVACALATVGRADSRCRCAIGGADFGRARFRRSEASLSQVERRSRIVSIVA